MPCACGASRRGTPRDGCTCIRFSTCLPCSRRWPSIAWWRTNSNGGALRMVLDAKALTWAAKNDIDTAKLKKARVPIYGKWYFHDIPPGVPLVNLETGEQQVFPERMVAGEVIYVPAADLQRASLAPEDFAVMDLSSGPGPAS